VINNQNDKGIEAERFRAVQPLVQV
jgi:hypothetical protein